MTPYLPLPIPTCRVYLPPKGGASGASSREATCRATCRASRQVGRGRKSGTAGRVLARTERREPLGTRAATGVTVQPGTLFPAAGGGIGRPGGAWEGRACHPVAPCQHGELTTENVTAPSVTVAKDVAQASVTDRVLRRGGPRQDAREKHGRSSIPAGSSSAALVRTTGRKCLLSIVCQRVACPLGPVSPAEPHPPPHPPGSKSLADATGGWRIPAPYLASRLSYPPGLRSPVRGRGAPGVCVFSEKSGAQP